MTIPLKQGEFKTVNLSTLYKHEFVATWGFITMCSSFSAIGKNRKGELVGLFGHAFGGDVPNEKLKTFASVIKSQGIRQLNILDITDDEYTEQRIKETYRTENVQKWADDLLETGIIDGYKLSSKVSISINSVHYTNDGIVAKSGCLPEAIRQLPDTSKGQIDQIDNLNDISAIKPKRKTDPKTPLLDKSASNDKESTNCCVIL
ncbi:MAG: hypothetical protein EP298_02580 [Gammaproteobacteria bacterium]|nr:MAG: hypothetical protein EP298_02580 [Gammaproteobacteria bacterium]UTW43427.1 hypothetical protein KFE69_04855 [bacterium SCSIO 12844]